MSHLLTTRDLVVGYGGRGILPVAAFGISKGELWAVIGQNGGGKTTLLRTLLGFLPPVRGSVSFAPGLRIGYVPQRSEVDLSVPSRVKDLVRGGVDRGLSFLSPFHVVRARAAVERAMEVTSTSLLARLRFSELSEGQKQRVLLARALVGRPDLLVLDEPTSAMDIGAERSVFELLDSLRQEHGVTMVLVTHHLAFLAGRASHAVLVDKDRHLLVGGTFDAVTASSAFIERYGFLVEDSPLMRAVESAASLDSGEP